MALEEKFKEVAENPFYSLAYTQFLREKRLMGSKCKKCGHTSVPPKPICDKCQRDEVELVEMKGNGKLVAYTVIGTGAPLMVEEGFDRAHPYCSGVVELEEGARILARILGVDVEKPEQIKIGAPVSVEYVEAEHGGEKKVFLAFRVLL
ncbi:MAG: Zn-ribbon domain-containing OB-fold protein [Deltaproteobacteria bacterium]|nr:Zn-ribbon domain-containing OB-fold protein [Deltaproteobacteria bacterium]